MKNNFEFVKKCEKCCIPVDYPKINFKENNGKFYCEECFNLINSDFNREELTVKSKKIIDKIKNNGSNYDAIFAYSGGKDSTAALYSAVNDYKLNLLVFNFDNGYKGEKVKQNINNVVNDLNVDFYQIKSKTSYTISDDISKKIMPCGRCSSLRKIYPELCERFNVKYIITGIECVFNNEVIRDRGTYYQINWPAALNWNKNDINKIVINTPWKDPGYNNFDSDCLAPGIALQKIYNYENSNFDMYMGKKEQHVVPYYARLVRYGYLTKQQFFDFINLPIKSSDEAILEYEKISKEIIKNEKVR